MSRCARRGHGEIGKPRLADGDRPEARAVSRAAAAQGERRSGCRGCLTREPVLACARKRRWQYADGRERSGGRVERERRWRQARAEVRKISRRRTDGGSHSDVRRGKSTDALEHPRRQQNRPAAQERALPTGARGAGARRLEGQLHRPARVRRFAQRKSGGKLEERTERVAALSRRHVVAVHRLPASHGRSLSRRHGRGWSSDGPDRAQAAERFALLARVHAGDGDDGRLAESLSGRAWRDARHVVRHSRPIQTLGVAAKLVCAETHRARRYSRVVEGRAGCPRLRSPLL